MKFLNALGSIFWLMLLVIACNTNPNSQNAAGDAKDSTATVDNTAANNSIADEKFPDGGGYKGRHNDYVFYLELTETEVKGFVLNKKNNVKNEVNGKMTSPFTFEVDELGEDESGDEKVVAKIRGKLIDGNQTATIDYNDVSSSNTFSTDLKL